MTGRVAVVTGAGRGIGRVLALRMAEEGAIVVVSSRTPADLEEVLSVVRRGGGEGLAVTADMADPQGAREPVRQATASFGRVDILVNNVGGRALAAGADSDPFSCPDDVFADLITLNLSSAWWTTREALGGMRRRRFGRVINIGSGSSQRAGGSVAYTAAKHGIIGMTRALALSCAPAGITVNCLCPGWTNTPHNDWSAVGKRMGGLGPDEARRVAESESAQRRILEPEELTGAAILLASDEGKGITGQVIAVDGGYKI